MSLLLLLCSFACRNDAPEAVPAEAFPAAASRTTFASAEALGAYVLEAHVETTEERPGDTSTVQETSRLRWQDADHWQWERERGGERLTEARVWDGEAWVATDRGRFEKRPDAEPLFADLRQQADPWAAALGTNADRVSYTEAGEEDIEGRKVWRYTLGLTPGPPGGRRSRDVVAIDGQLWIDQATAVRLAGDVTLKARFRDTVRTTHLRFAMTGLGGDPAVAPPPAEAP